MHKPELYSRANSLQRSDAKYVLDGNFQLVKCRSEGVYMDVGCGSGDVTLELLLPLLPSGFRKLIGTDVSEAMVQESARKSKDKRVVFKTCNIAENADLEEFKGQIDHIFSFYCLHWVRNQRTAYQNMFDMLKPGGDILLTYLADNPIYHIYRNLAGMTRWAPHMQNWERFCSPYHQCDNTQAKLEELLDTVGFISHVCKVETRSFTYPNMDILRKSVLAITPFTKKMQESEIDDFIDDYVSLVRKTKDIDVAKCNNNNEEQVTLYYQLIIICASKLL